MNHVSTHVFFHCQLHQSSIFGCRWFLSFGAWHGFIMRAPSSMIEYMGFMQHSLVWSELAVYIVSFFPAESFGLPYLEQQVVPSQLFQFCLQEYIYIYPKTMEKRKKLGKSEANSTLQVFQCPLASALETLGDEVAHRGLEFGLTRFFWSFLEVVPN